MHRIEIQVRRNLTLRTRPEIFDYDPQVPGRYPLHPGAATTMDDGQVSVGLSAGVLINRFWMSLLTTLIIDGVKFSEARPAVLFLETADIPTLTHFPELAPESNRRLGGWWTIGLRSV